jgi:cell division septum initiation protein DivIVA
MADPLDSSNIARKAFEVSRRGYEQQEVRAFLHEVSSLVERLQREEAKLRERAERAEARLGLSDRPDEAMLLEILGEETTRVLSSAREAGSEIRTKADAAAERIIGEANAEAAETRADAIREADRRLAEATAESESVLALARTELERRSAEAEEAAARIREEGASQAQALRDEGKRDLERAQEEAAAAVEAGRVQGREMVGEAQAVRERVLRDLAARRKKARMQVEKLNAGRERLLQAYDLVRRTIDEATNELTVSLSDARLAADAAARRIEDEADPTLEQLDEEVSNAGLVDLPIADLELGELAEDSDAAVDDDEPGPFSGEVPVVVPTGVDERAPATVAPPVNIEERRSRKGRRRKGFEGLPPGELTKVELPAEGEGMRILADPPPESEPEPPAETSAPGADATEAPTEEADAVADTVEPEVEAVADDPAPEEAEAPTPPLEAETEDVDAPSVNELFARLRAETGDEDAPATDAEAVEAEAEPEEEVESEESPEGAPFRARDAALESVDKELSRRLKRALADEQNEVLDLLRRAKPKGVDDLLPAAEEHVARWAATAADALTDAAKAGAAGAKHRPTADLADELAQSLTAPLRDRIDRSFAASDGNLDDVADRVRALYREWKGQRLSESSRHFLAAAYARGTYDAVPADGSVRWILDPSVPPCPDCDDNVLGGALAKGTEFPTGHTCAPAHPGCRCLVVAADD